jgi:hypothetical protein
MKEWKYIPSTFSVCLLFSLWAYIFETICTSKIQNYEKQENKRMLTFILYKNKKILNKRI